MKILLDGTIETLKTRQDGTVTVAFSTQELDSSKGGELFQLRGKYCKALFSDTNISNLEEEIIDKEKIVNVKKNKTESQRLRGVLFRYWETLDTVEFEQFYKTEMDKIINHYKSKLE